MRQAELPNASVSQVESAVESLREEFRPLLVGAVEHQAEQLGLPPGDLTAPPAGSARAPARPLWSELFSRGAEVVAAQLMVGGRRVQRDPSTGTGRVVQMPSTLRLHGIGPTGADDLLHALADALAQRLDVTFSPWAYRSARFDELEQEEGMKCAVAPTDEERQAAQLLSNSLNRTAAVAIASSGGLLIADLPKQLPDEDRDRSDEVAVALQEGGLVTSELLVTCRRTNTQVARVPSESAIEAAAREGFKCASCGRSVSDERVEEALALTAHGRAMLDGSRWLSVLLATELMAVGVDPERMLIEQTSGGDESDCLADISGELLFFELKDKEFNLGNAYSFGSKIAVFRPEHSVVVTTAYVGNDAKEHFEKARAPDSPERPYLSNQPDRRGDINYIEGIENLRTELRQLAEQIYADDAASVLGDVLGAAALDAHRTVEALRKAQTQEGMEPAPDPEAVGQPT